MESFWETLIRKRPVKKIIRGVRLLECPLILERILYSVLENNWISDRISTRLNDGKLFYWRVSEKVIKCGKYILHFNSSLRQPVNSYKRWLLKSNKHRTKLIIWKINTHFSWMIYSGLKRRPSVQKKKLSALEGFHISFPTLMCFFFC